MMVVLDRKIQTNKVEQVDLKPFASYLKKHEAFYSLTVVVFCRGDYLKCHTLMGVNNTV